MKHNAGFSLMEVMCAIMILGIGVVGITLGITTALSSNKEAELQTNAALLAAGQIETLRAEGYLIEGEDEGEYEDLPAYSWQQSITTTTIEGLYDVKVTVLHAATGAAVYELRTLLFDPPYLPETVEPTETNRTNPRSRRNPPE